MLQVNYILSLTAKKQRTPLNSTKRPLYARFYRYTKGKAYHAMCLDGYRQYTSGNQYYHFVNPQNDTGWFLLDSGKVEYTNDSGTTYKWFAAIYNI